METKHIQMTGTKLRESAQFTLDALMAAQKAGLPIDEVLLGCSYALGAAIAQRGGVLLLDQPIEKALPPLAHGYKAAQREMQQA